MKINGELQVLGQILDLKPEVLTEDPALETLSVPRLWVRDGVARFFNGENIISLREGTVTDEQLATKLGDYLKTADLDLSGYDTKDDVTQKISDATSALVSSTALATQLESYSTNAVLDAKFADYSTTTETDAEIQTAVQNLVSTSSMQQAIDNAVAGLDFQADVLGLESDFTNVAGRYVFLGGNKFSGSAEAGDIVVVDGAGTIQEVAYDVSEKGPGALVWNRTTTEDAPNGQWFRYNGTDWSAFGGLAGVTVGNGLDKNGDAISLVLDGASLVVSANGIKVGDLSATYATVNALQQAIANFVTASQVGTQIAEALTNYATTADLNTKLADYAKTADVDTKLADYAKTADIAEVYETQQHATDTYATKTSLNQYAKTVDVDTKLADYAQTDAVAETYATKDEIANFATTQDIADTYATKTELGDYATTQTVADTYATKTEVADFATTQEVADTYATKTEIADFATTQEVADTYATKTELGDYATTSDVSATYATKESVTENSGLITGSFYNVAPAAAATSHIITHNLGFRFPVVQVVDAATNKLIIPGDIEFTTENALVITFSVATKVNVSVTWLKTAAAPV